MNRDIAIKNLRDVQLAFPLGFLAYGSALGAYRDGDIIGHDLDTDFGVFSGNFSFEAINQLTDKGFKILNVFGMRHYGFEIALARDGVKTDIMVIYYDEENGKFWNSLWDNGGRKGMSDEIRHEYKSQVFDFMGVKRLGEFNFNCPSDKYIEAVYGEDWMIPVKEWNWRTDHKCNIIHKHE